jgi:hypothetical protein
VFAWRPIVFNAEIPPMTNFFDDEVVGKSETNAGCQQVSRNCHGKISFLFTFYGESKAHVNYRSIHISLHQFEVKHFLVTRASEKSNAVGGNWGSDVAEVEPYCPVLAEKIHRSRTWDFKIN